MKFKINPGELKHPIVIQRAVPGKNNDNIPELNWTDILNVKAKVLNIRGNEFYKAQSVGSKVEKTFYIRTPKTLEITNEDRVIYNNIAYNIIYSNDIEESGRYLEIKCEVTE